ncbi:MAG: 4Fe-4S binding protein [Bacteroidales bacterium]|nr:4Fe-4S binding protein [Bacteroidales bacterium]
MYYKITDDCVSCGSCVDYCEQNAISAGEAHYEIDPTLCIGCGKCAGECPMGAIVEGE